MREILKKSIGLIKKDWKRLFWFELLYKLAFVVIIWPVCSLLWRTGLKISGIGYVSLDKIMSYADFKKYVDKQDLAEVWCAVQVAELEKEEEGVVNFQSNIPNIGFVCNPSYNTAIKWDEKKYPNLLPGCETQDMGNEDEWDDPEENLKSESNARQHFVSLLNYLSNQKKFLAMMEKDNSNYTTKELKEMVSYIKKNGIKVYGFTTIADKETLLKLSKQSEVYEIYTEEVR